MNDLNSVYIVGRLVGKPKKVEAGLSFVIANQLYKYDEVKKEYTNTTEFVPVLLLVKDDNEKQAGKLNKGLRVGINGRLETKDKAYQVVSNVIQILDPAMSMG